MQIIIIAAVANNLAIGRNNQLLWNIPEDMAHFRTLTKGKTVVMGRKTWDSLPEKFRPLPGRRNIVITRQSDFNAPGAELASSLEDAFELCKDDPEVFVMGGAQIYEQAMSFADRLELTIVDQMPEADAFFPEVDPNVWTTVSLEEHNGFSFTSHKRKIENTFNPFTHPDIKPEKIAEIILSLMPEAPELNAEEQAALEKKQKESNQKWMEERFGKLPENTYRILEQGSFMGWYLEIEIDGVAHPLKDEHESEFCVYQNRKNADKIARQIIAKHHGEDAAKNAKFKIMFGGQM